MLNKFFFKHGSEKEIIDLGLHPFADTFVKKNQLDICEPLFPLKCFLNSKTGYIRNSIITNDVSRYNLYDYSYTSSNSSYSRKYWIKYGISAMNEFEIDQNTKILEIGSNDGFLLKQFRKKTNKLWGNDASKFMCELSKKSKIRSFNCIFNSKNSGIIKNQIGSIDIIIANNVLNHANNPYDFLKGVHKLLAKKGVVIFELPYWYHLVKQEKFDQIYHEHISYFTIKFAFNILKACGLEITKIIETDYHGGSIRVFAKKSKKIKKNKIVKEYIFRETKDGIFKRKTYEKITKSLIIKKQKFLKKIINYKLMNYKVIGVGAAAKANTFLNFIGIDSSLMDFVTDNSKYKIAKYTPLSRIPIKHDNALKKAGKKVCVVILSWNLEKILKLKLPKLNRNIKFLTFYN